MSFEPGELGGRTPLVAAAVRSGDLAAEAVDDLRQRQHARPSDPAEEPVVRSGIQGRVHRVRCYSGSRKMESRC
jgi:hypothetical protein